jgi:MinD-like ATPase involved in chromosome partitioning or flagellar assembly
MKIAIVNTKGGASKSTTAFQVASAYMLSKNLDFKHIELDDENRDAETFAKSKIVTEQVGVGDGSDLNNTLRNLLLQNENLVIDVGGNKTTTLFLENLQKTRMYRLIDLFIIPSSGGSQDIKNAIKTYKLIKEMHPDAKVLFVLSRVRNPARVKFQFAEFFNTPEIDEKDKQNYIILKDSDVVDLSRILQKSIYEIVEDKDTKKALENAFDEALLNGDNNTIEKLSIMLEIYDEAENFYNNYIAKAFGKLDEMVKE